MVFASERVDVLRLDVQDPACAGADGDRHEQGDTRPDRDGRQYIAPHTECGTGRHERGHTGAAG